MAYFDFKKAFNSVPHQRLLLKLKSYKIEGCLPLFFVPIENKELLLMTPILASLMSMAASLKDQYWPFLYINDLPDTL